MAAAFPQSAYEGVPMRDLRDVRGRVVWLDFSDTVDEALQFWLEHG